MSLPRSKGSIVTEEGQAVLVARCPLCGADHRYPKGNVNGPEVEELRRRGFSDEWLPCQVDMPGNFWRVAIRGGSGGKKRNEKRSHSRRDQ